MQLRGIRDFVGDANPQAAGGLAGVLKRVSLLGKSAMAPGVGDGILRLVNVGTKHASAAGTPQKSQKRVLTRMALLLAA